LSKAFRHVDSVDLAKPFVDLAQQLLKRGELSWDMPVDRTTGKIVPRTIQKEDLSPGSVNFDCLNAESLPEDMTGYDLICGFNTIDRMERPKAFLVGVKDRLNKGGLLVLSSAWDWSEEFTPKDQWLGGYKYGDNDGPSSYQGLRELLESEGFVEALPSKDLWHSQHELDNGRRSERTRVQMTFWQLC